MRKVIITSGILNQGESESVTAALRNTLWERGLLILGRCLQFFRIKITSKQFLIQIIKGDALHDIHRIDNVAQRLAHLTAFRISNEGMTVDLLEWNLSCQLQTEHYVTSELVSCQKTIGHLT